MVPFRTITTTVGGNNRSVYVVQIRRLICRPPVHQNHINFTTAQQTANKGCFSTRCCRRRFFITVFRFICLTFEVSYCWGARSSPHHLFTSVVVFENPSNQRVGPNGGSSLSGSTTSTEEKRNPYPQNYHAFDDPQHAVSFTVFDDRANLKIPFHAQNDQPLLWALNLWGTV